MAEQHLNARSTATYGVPLVCHTPTKPIRRGRIVGAAPSSAAEPVSGGGTPGARPLTDAEGRPMQTIVPCLGPPVTMPRRLAVLHP